MRFWMSSAALAAFALMTTGSLPEPVARAQDAAPVVTDDVAGFPTFLNQLRSEAVRRGISQPTIERVFAGLTYNPRVVELDRAQPGGSPSSSAIPPFAPYLARHVDTARIERGRAAYQRLRANLSRIEAETGVPEAIMVAIYGKETNYGSYTGDFDLPRALVSLAYEGRRRALFSEEFLAALQMVDRGVPLERLKGSWAGATGYPQFLPSVYLRLARDGDGDGKADIWTSEADALASIANYFVAAGWRPNVPWGVEASVPADLNRAALASRLVSPRCPRVHERHSRWLSIAEWRALGVRPQSNVALRDSEQATLLEPDGPGRPAYLLTGNYRVILDYNCSNFYALSVGVLADAVSRQ